MELFGVEEVCISECSCLSRHDYLLTTNKTNLAVTAIDNKHNVVAQLGALEEILSSGKLPKRTLYITCGHDEEIGGLEGAKRIAKLLEEDNLNFEFILDEGTMMISGAIPGYKEGPIALIGCAEKGAMNIEMTVTGPGGHSSVPPIDKDNPLKIMSKAIVAMESNPLPAHFEPNTLFRSTLEYVANKLAFPLNLICSNFWLFGPLFKSILLRASNGAAASIRTTTAVTKIHGGEKINAIPSEVKAYVNHRLHPSDSFQSVIEHDRYVYVVVMHLHPEFRIHLSHNSHNHMEPIGV